MREVLAQGAFGCVDVLVGLLLNRHDEHLSDMSVTPIDLLLNYRQHP
jgi:hypothetical protein